MEFKSCENYISVQDSKTRKSLILSKKNCFGSNILEFGMLRYN